MDKLKSLSDTYYTKTKSGNPTSDYPTVLAAIEDACRIKPKNEHPLSILHTKATPLLKSSCGAQISKLAACVNNYLFHAASKVDTSADADMLLTGSAKDITFKYFLIHRYSLIHAANLFEDDTSLLLLALVFQKASTVKELLAVSGAEFTDKDLDSMVLRHLKLYQQQYGGNGWDEAFEELRETMGSRWHSSLATAYKGYHASGTYHSLSIR
ncbi:uncharacterized protein ALTATR162_LOCUS2376 [Alternaria atra]|uniref:Uncharacterized protein n=1 Tax=Alternaria atra TaxID=119953 RepID=A0A8J2HYE0_9PLEO|nr:uncharacterized protein ALTATR162_LOCUS2376 [Alternaria atra]CAG5149474.1 unnamed protein product [Alternaria atra]